MKTTHTPNLDRLDPMAREILGDVLTGLFRIHPIAPPVASGDDDEVSEDELAEAFRDVYAAAAAPIDTTALTQAFGPLLPENFK